MDAGSLAGLKALYSDARKRAAVAAGIGAYLYTALEPRRAADRPAPTPGPSDPPPRQERPARALPRDRGVAAPAATGRAWTDAVLRDLGEILAHGEPEPGWARRERRTARARRRSGRHAVAVHLMRHRGGRRARPRRRRSGRRRARPRRRRSGRRRSRRGRGRRRGRASGRDFKRGRVAVPLPPAPPTHPVDPDLHGVLTCSEG